MRPGPPGPAAGQPVTTAAIDTLGGTRAGDMATQQAGWSKVLGLLAQLSR